MRLNKSSVPIEEILITDELTRRAARPPDCQRENQALRALSRSLGDSPDAAMQELCNQALLLCRAESAGLSLAETDAGKEIFRWRAVAGRLSPFLNGTMPRDFSPCGYVIATRTPQLMECMVRYYEYVAQLGTHLQEVLLVPFFLDGKAMGTLWIVAHSEGRCFDAEDLRLLTVLAEFTSGVVQSWLKSRSLERRAQQLLDADHIRQEIQSRLSRALSVAHIGFYEWNAGSQHLMCGPQMQKDWGIGPQPSVRTALARVHRGDRRRVLQALKEALHEGTGFRVQCRVRSRDTGQYIWIDAQGEGTCDAAGTPRRLFGTTLDITAAKTAQLRAISERQRFESLFSSSSSAVALLHGPEAVYEMINPAYAALISDRPVVGKSFAQAFPELLDTEVPELLRRVYETGESVSISEIFLTVRNPITGLNEERYFEGWFNRVLDEEGNPYGVINASHEITERVLAAQRMEAFNQDLQREREIRERFVSTLTHDLRTPMTSARLSAERLLRKAGHLDFVETSAVKIMRNLDRADRMINDLLDANRIKAGHEIPLKRADCRIDAVVGRVCEQLISTYGERFIVHNAAGRVEGHWDGEAIQRMLENLASNAVKYGSTTAPVTLGLRRLPQNVEFFVHNEGNPIAPEDQRSLFEQFKRTKGAEHGSQGGWGLGLTLVQGIAKAHGGSVHLESTAQEGTTFVVRLPMA